MVFAILAIIAGHYFVRPNSKLWKKLSELIIKSFALFGLCWLSRKSIKIDDRSYQYEHYRQ